MGLFNLYAHKFLFLFQGEKLLLANSCSFLYRPEYYGLTEDELGNPTQGISEVIIAKHRNGSLDNVALRFIAKYTKFTNLETNDFQLQPTYETVPSNTIIKPSRVHKNPLDL